MTPQWSVQTLAGIITRILLTLLSGWLVDLGFTEEQITEQLGAIAAGVAGLLVTIAWAFWSQWRKQQDLPKPKAADQRLMQNFRGGHGGQYAFLLAIPLIALMVGCQSRLATAYATREMVNTALQESLNLHTSGAITDDQLRLIRDAGKAASPVLDELDRAAIEGNRFNWNIVLNEARQQVDRVLRAAIEARLKKPKELTWTRPLPRFCYPPFPQYQSWLT